jgi:ISSag3, transposase
MRLAASVWRQLPKIFRSIAGDNGSAFSGLTDPFKEGCIHFTHPYSSMERRANENQNSLLRRFILKGKATDTVSDYTVAETRGLKQQPAKENIRIPLSAFTNGCAWYIFIVDLTKEAV